MKNSGTKYIQVTINGKECSVFEGMTILEAARQQGLSIPSLCDDRRLEPYGSCWVCLLKVEGAKGFVPSCATRVKPGMKIITDDEEIRKARKLAFELLLSNHYGDCKAPCTLACPSNIDVQGYVGLISHGKNAEALRLIKEDNPFPSVCGRVCPRPCEAECRRNLVDRPVGIDYLKRYVADIDLFSEDPYSPVCAPDTGKRVAVIGGGPAGLSAAYYLRRRGVGVRVYEAQEKAGGMLRYGIPDYRLPQDVLDREICLVSGLGAEIIYGRRLGENLQLEDLLTKHDAVLLALGAWKSRSLRISGEDLPGVVPGIDMLRAVARGESTHPGVRVAVIGGGNTAIDAARSALRLGADDVRIFYRRSRDEMPATDMEIEEALEEGIGITYLAAPTAITQNGEKGLNLHLIRMKLGDPDASGRRRPVPEEGSDFSWAADTIVSAVGQYADSSPLTGMEDLVDEKGYIVCDPETGSTPVAGLFAAGDLVTGPDIAIRAIAGGKHAAASIVRFLNGKPVERKKEFIVRKADLQPVTAEDLADEEKIDREVMPTIPLEQRRRSFTESELGFSPEQAVRESRRCLECGCQDVHECKLKTYAEEYGATVTRFPGVFNRHPIDASHPHIVRDPSKCILCGRCVRICLEVQGLGVLGYVKRGFSSIIEPSFGRPFGEVDRCISCGQCVSACPVGALTEKFPSGKTVPLKEDIREGYCPMCSVGCPVEYRSHGTLFTRVTERFNDYGGTLCERGRFLNPYVQDADRAAGCIAGEKRLESREAEGLLASYVQNAGKILMRISPFLSGEVIDYLTARAVEIGCVVQPIGLDHLNPGWIELNNLGRGGSFTPSEKNDLPIGRRRPFNLENHYFFEDTGSDPQRRAAVILGGLCDSNNVAFTDTYRMKRDGLFSLWVVGDNGPAAQRAADRVFPNLMSLEDALQYAQFERRMVDILVNPEDIHSCSERETENRLIQVIGEASTWQKLRVTLFWNSRNAWYLLKTLGENSGIRGGGREGIEDYDLILDFGGDLSGSDNRRIVRWGGRSEGADLFIPLPLSFWTEGYCEPSGRAPVRVGTQDAQGIRTTLLM